MANQYTNPWTDEMDNFLLENGGTRSLSWIAKKLERTEAAVKRRMERIGAEDKHALSGTLTGNQFAQALGVDAKIIQRWIQDKGMPASQGDYYSEGKLKLQRYKRYFINVDKFWKWAQENRDIINWHKVEPHCLPPEPDWVSEQRKIDFYKWENQRMKWTKEQDELLWKYYYTDGLSQRKIANLMGRTRSGVERRIRRLREKKFKEAKPC